VADLAPENDDVDPLPPLHRKD